MTQEEKDRLIALKAKLAARTSHDGKPLSGYVNNVAAIRAAISELEAIDGDA